MKNINYMNYAMVGIPLILMLAGWMFESDLVIAGMLLTILTGAFQLICGIGMYFNGGCKESSLGFYLIGVTVFFALWIFTDWFWIIALPPMLALYLSVIIFIKAKNDKP